MKLKHAIEIYFYMEGRSFHIEPIVLKMPKKISVNTKEIIPLGTVRG
jgi:hypothetical protein